MVKQFLPEMFMESLNEMRYYQLGNFSATVNKIRLEGDFIQNSKIQREDTLKATQLSFTFKFITGTRPLKHVGREIWGTHDALRAECVCKGCRYVRLLKILMRWIPKWEIIYKHRSRVEWFLFCSLYANYKQITIYCFTLNSAMFWQFEQEQCLWSWYTRDYLIDIRFAFSRSTLFNGRISVMCPTLYSMYVAIICIMFTLIVTKQSSVLSILSTEIHGFITRQIIFHRNLWSCLLICQTLCVLNYSFCINLNYEVSYSPNTYGIMPCLTEWIALFYGPLSIHLW